MPALESETSTFSISSQILTPSLQMLTSLPEITLATSSYGFPQNEHRSLL
jgi:hypothetical protein